MTFLRNNLMLIVGALILAGAVIVGYRYMQSSSSGNPLQSSGDSSTTPDLAGADSLLTDLANLQQVRLNTAVFSDPAFRALVDYYVTIPTQPVGNPNPFAPLPGTKPAGH